MQIARQTEKHSNLIYDVGMHHGEDAEFYLRKGFRVVGFEALPENVEICHKQLAEFVSTGQLVLVQGAIVDSADVMPSRKISFYRNEGHSVWGTARWDWAERNERLGLPSNRVEVDAIDFERALHDYGVPHYLKLDIEGCDMGCVKALRNIQARPDYISLESSKISIAEIKNEISTLRSLGYERFQAVEQSSIPALHRPPRPAREGNYVDHRFLSGSSGLFGAELPGKWRAANEILHFYRAVHCAYFLVGDEGVLNRFAFPGAWRIRSLVKRCLKRLVRGPVPGWYDTHACHSSVNFGNRALA